MDGKISMSAATGASRRRVLQGSAAFAGVLALGSPAIVRAQADKLKIGHLTPLTGFLGTLGGYAQLGARLAVEEINQSGGVLGRPIELIPEDSVNP
jgi:branched-chain amino acid transport system substrate-binding protein